MTRGLRQGVLAWVAMGVVLSVPAHGQSVEAVAKVTEIVNARREDINDACGRLRPMVLSGSAREAAPIQAMLTLSAALDSTTDGVSLVGEILTGMKSPEDLAVAQAVFRRAARRALESANDQLDFVNANLQVMKSPAAVAEIIIIRDSMRAIRDAVKPFAARDQQ